MDQDVYVAGIASTGQYGGIAVWKNGVPTYLTDGPNHIQIKGMCVSGSDVYVSGSQSMNSGWIGYLWKNGQPQALSNIPFSEGTSVFVK